MDNPINVLIQKEDIESILNYFGNIGPDGKKLEINDIETYRVAFTHESYYQSVQNFLMTKNEQTEKQLYLNYIPKESSERLEYLGDHALKFIMGRYLFERYPNEREGFLTKLKIKIEKCSMLHKIGIVLGFKKYILLSLQVENQTILDSHRGRNTPSYYEDSFEAFVGAIVNDFGEIGYLYADRFVRNVIENIIDFAELISKNDNFKDSLQRYFQSLKWKTPTYIDLTKEGPLYRIMFTRSLVINMEQYSILDSIVQNNISKYNMELLSYYKNTNNENNAQFSIIYNKLYEIIINNKEFVIGIGTGRKVIQSEQECAKNSLINLNISLNY